MSYNLSKSEICAKLERIRSLGKNNGNEVLADFSEILLHLDEKSSTTANRTLAATVIAAVLSVAALFYSVFGPQSSRSDIVNTIHLADRPVNECATCTCANNTDDLIHSNPTIDTAVDEANGIKSSAESGEVDANDQPSAKQPLPTN